MKLGVSINLFNGEELLEDCLYSFRPFADYIVVIYQNVSNFGTHEKNLHPLIDSLVEKKLIDHAIYYTPTKDFQGLEEGTIELIKNEGNQFNGVNYDESIYYGIFNEIEKRNTSLRFLRDTVGCSHLLDADTDEFYCPTQIRKAINHIKDGKFDASFCQMQTYYKFNDTVIYPPESYYVPFIYQLKWNSRFEQVENADFPVFCDGKRRIRNAYPYVFSRNELEMHHLSYVRKDMKSMESKFSNCSSRMNFPKEKIKMICKHWEEYKKGGQAIFNGNGEGVNFFETKIVKPLFKINMK